MEKAANSAKKGVKISNVTKNVLVCRWHGEYDGYVSTSPLGRTEGICPQCHEKEAQEDRKELYDRISKGSSINMFTASCIPKRYQRETFERYEPTTPKAEHIKQIMMNVAEHFKKVLEDGSSFLMTGGPGTGKTHLACALAMDIILQGYTASYMTLIECVAKVKTAWNPAEGKSEEDIISGMAEVDLLILDELNIGAMSNKELGIVFRVIDRRYLDEKPTIGISNMSKAVVNRIIGEGPTSRLQAGGGGHLEFNWKDYRIK